ncbi:MAG: C4-dicarboxylate ABC transporter, partial [Burkholderiaceae bacterium]|nr:C4-dicarboxylate ABC transporter [Burkholderiaceae bacterium]
MLACLLGCLPAVPALSQSPIVIKFSHVVAKDTPKGKAAD